MEQIYTPKLDYKVLVRCFTYNHSKYIEDALNGFVLQQTTFPFVCLVMDDCSTDGEQDVIKAWMERECDMTKAEYIEIELSNIILVPHGTNANCTFLFYLLKRNLYRTGKKVSLVEPLREHCEYEAICEGDDYWVHPQKLQKQVLFLDSHIDYGLVHTDFNLTNGRRNHKVLIKSDGCYYPEIILKELTIGTLTVMYRLSIYHKLPKFFKAQRWPIGDKPLWIEFSYTSKIHYIDEVTANYRVLVNSASHSTDINKLINFQNTIVEIRRFYADKYGLSEMVYYDKSYYELIERYACRLGNQKIANSNFLEAKQASQVSLKCIVFYFAAFSPLLKKVIEKIIKI